MTIRDMLSRRPDGTPILGTLPERPPSTEPAIRNGVEVVDVLRNATGITPCLPMLTDSEQAELAELAAESQKDADPGTILRSLDALTPKQRKRTEALIEKSVADRGLFVRLRAEAKDAATLRALSERAHRPTPVTSTLSSEILDQLAAGNLRGEHLALLSLVSVILDAAEIPNPTWKQAMSFDRRKLVLKYVPADVWNVPNLSSLLAQLQACGWLTVECELRRGPWLLSPGPRWVKARRAA